MLGAAQSGVRSSLRLLSVVQDGDVIDDAREGRRGRRGRSDAGRPPALAAAVRELEHSEQADYLED